MMTTSELYPHPAQYFADEGNLSSLMVAVAIHKGLFVFSILFNFSDAPFCFLHHSYRASQPVLLPPASIRKLSGAGIWGRRLHRREKVQENHSLSPKEMSTFK